jgi:hypothetical protein
MPEIRIGRGKVYVHYVGENRFVFELLDKTGTSSAKLEMSKQQLDTLGKTLQAIAKGK